MARAGRCTPLTYLTAHGALKWKGLFQGRLTLSGLWLLTTEATVRIVLRPLLSLLALHVSLNYYHYSTLQYNKHVSQCVTQPFRRAIALFTVNFSLLHYNVIQRGCESISG